VYRISRKNDLKLGKNTVNFDENDTLNIVVAHLFFLMILLGNMYDVTPNY